MGPAPIGHLPHKACRQLGCENHQTLPQPMKIPLSLKRQILCLALGFARSAMVPSANAASLMWGGSSDTSDNSY